MKKIIIITICLLLTCACSKNVENGDPTTNDYIKNITVEEIKKTDDEIKLIYVSKEDNTKFETFKEVITKNTLNPVYLLKLDKNEAELSNFLNVSKINNDFLLAVKNGEKITIEETITNDSVLNLINELYHKSCDSRC
ncbi:MAG: hypothetical protein MST00_00230 [Tenericutes bacterium]|nr:hypothetical protein [Mycoplasmatota bacterium]